MKMKIRVANPAGNITVFVMDKVQREQRYLRRYWTGKSCMQSR
mgnify:CR=1 FL=1